MGLYGMDMDLLKAIWNGMEMDMDSYVNPHVDFVAWIRTLKQGFHKDDGHEGGIVEKESAK